MIKITTYRFHPTLFAISCIVLGIIIHWGCYIIWGPSYSGVFYRLASEILGFAKGIGTPIIGIFDWCYKFSGWALFPLTTLIGYSLYNCFGFILADIYNTPLQNSSEKLNNLSYASEVASDVGFAATLYYIIVALIILAAALLGDSSENSSTNEMTAKAIMMVATALGSTFVAIIPTRCHGHAEWLVGKWNRNGGQDEY